MLHTSTEETLTLCKVSESRSSAESKPLVTLQRNGRYTRVDAVEIGGLMHVEHKVSEDFLFQM